MRPDLLIVGDSHTAALHQAARARGLDARLFFLSGNYWHENRMRPHAELGISAAYRRPLQRQVQAFAGEVGGSVFPPGVPVLASIGYHLGRLVPVFTRHGHTPVDDPDESRLFVSDAFLRSFILHNRGNLLRILRRAARQSDLLVIAPPMIQADPVSLHFARTITAMLTEAGIRVFDPRQEPDWADQPLPESLRAADGVHGNAAYGEQVLKRLFDRGLIRAA
ncbi:hypothetical protein [Gemmobacter sp.]|uniref:hypothetical protein n=1 Tax=Gemmobacter sp. TaxID=1898957 RepID=UPI002AFF690B|nr:hypothetical protein [Gemmobacter sp.]